MQTKRRSYFTVENLLVFLALALILGYEAWGIGVPGIWQDEASTISGASRGPLGLMALSTTVDAVHALYYFGMSIWGSIFGFTPFAVRFPSALAVTAAVAVTYFVGRRVSGKRLGAISAVILALLPRMTWAATEARSYGFTALAGVLLFWLFLKVNEVEGSKVANKIKLRWWWFFAGVSTLASYIFVYALLLLLAGGLTLVIRRVSENHLKTYVKFSLISFAMSSIVLVFSFFQRDQISWIEPTTFHNLDNQLIDAPFGHGLQTDGVVGVLLAIAVVVLLIRQSARLKFLDSFRGIEFQHLLVVIVVPTVLLVAVSLAGESLYNPRYVTFLMPILALLMGWVFTLALPWPALVAVAAVLLATSLPVHDAQRGAYAKLTDWGTLAAAMKTELRPGDGMLYAGATLRPPWMRRISIAYLNEFKETRDLTQIAPYYAHFTLMPDPAKANVIKSRLLKESRVWLVFSKTKHELSGKLEAQWLHRAGFVAGPIHYLKFSRFQLWMRK